MAYYVNDEKLSTKKIRSGKSIKERLLLLKLIDYSLTQNFSRSYHGNGADEPKTAKLKIV